MFAVCATFTHPQYISSHLDKPVGVGVGVGVGVSVGVGVEINRNSD